MPITEALLPEFDQEMASTRKMLERVPDDRLDFKPHQKSWTMRSLANHLSMIPGWAVETMTKDSIDIAGFVPPPEAQSRQELLDQFDKGVTAGREVLAKAADADFSKPWSLTNNGTPMITLPRLTCIRSWVMNHLIHHRAQLGVYLRLNDIPVPQVYGPTADEP